MKEADVRKRAFAMPLTSPAYPPGPYRFLQREYLIITYRTDADKLRELVPEPLEVDQPVVRYGGRGGAACLVAANAWSGVRETGRGRHLGLRLTILGVARLYCLGLVL